MENDVQVEYLTVNDGGVLQGHGDVGTRLIENNWDVGILRPWRNPKNGISYVAKMLYNADGSPMLKEGKDPETGRLVMQPIRKTFVTNTVSPLRKDDWVVVDEAVLRVATPRLKLVGDLRAAGLTFTIPNGMGKTVFQYERVSNINAATISMDGVRQGDSDRPVFDLVNLPLPIIHKDFEFSARQLAASRNGGSPLDTTNAELAAERVAQSAEMLLLGSLGTYAFGGGTVYGYVNFPNRVTQAGTNHYAPTNGSYTPDAAVAEVLAMKQASIAAFHFGPWKLYHSLAWDQYMDADYNKYLGKTLRQRLLEIKGIEGCECSDFLDDPANPYQLLLVQQTSSVVREVVAMDITTLQWESQGGMKLHFKVMCIMVPQLRADQNGNTGLVHNIQS